jgi:hypothetical protein
LAFLDGVPLSILHDNTRIAVARICSDGKRERTRAFIELVSHYLFRDRFGRPGKGNDKGKVEGLLKYVRSNFMTPIPVAPSFEALNAMLAKRCRLRQDERAGRHAQTIAERLIADLAALRDLPAVPLEPCEKRRGRVSSTALCPPSALLRSFRDFSEGRISGSSQPSWSADETEPKDRASEFRAGESTGRAGREGHLFIHQGDESGFNCERD